jgi:hypothetical protein
MTNKSKKMLIQKITKNSEHEKLTWYYKKIHLAKRIKREKKVVK